MTASGALELMTALEPEFDDGDGGGGGDGDPPDVVAALNGMLQIMNDVLDKIAMRGEFFAAAVDRGWREVEAERCPDTQPEKET